ncbi:YcxB family protein [Microvirga guangxiensis]|nr:YcxB family protein [Microvirga guangxiensis]
MSDALTNAALGIIDIRFTPSAADMKVLSRLASDRALIMILTVLSRLGAFAFGAILTGAAVWALGVFESDMLQTVTFAIAGGLAGVVAFRLLIEKAWHQRIRQLPLKRARNMHVIGDGHALTVEAEHIKTRIAFSGIDRVVVVPTHLVLYHERILIAALPKKAFEESQAFDAFASFLQKRIAHQTHISISEKTA